MIYNNLTLTSATFLSNEVLYIWYFKSAKTYVLLQLLNIWIPLKTTTQKQENKNNKRKSLFYLEYFT